jgi:hypothetical protein
MPRDDQAVSAIIAFAYEHEKVIRARIDCRNAKGHGFSRRFHQRGCGEARAKSLLFARYHILEGENVHRTSS